MANSTDKSKANKIAFIQKHFMYEVQELLNARFFLSAVKKGEVMYSIPNPRNVSPAAISQHLGTISMNMALEHALMHSRILYEFYFVPEESKKAPHGHPRAYMYIDDYKKPAFTKNITAVFYDKVNNQITHLGDQVDEMLYPYFWAIAGLAAAGKDIDEGSISSFLTAAGIPVRNEHLSRAISLHFKSHLAYIVAISYLQSVNAPIDLEHVLEVVKVFEIMPDASAALQAIEYYNQQKVTAK